MRKKLFYTLFAFFVYLCLFGGVYSYAETYGVYTYTITDNQVTITDCNASASGRKNIPETIEGYPVTSISAGAFSFCNYITSVTIPDTVTSIGRDAFDNCTELQSVTIGKGVTSIGSRAFANCLKLSSVTISDLAAWCNIDFADQYSNPLCQKADFLYMKDADSITDLVIPEGITQIKPYAFYSCGKLTSVQLHDGVTTIGNQAFRFCEKIKNLIIPDSVTSIGEKAFEDTSGITKVYYGGSEEDWNKINKGLYFWLFDSVIYNAVFSETYTLASGLPAGASVIFAYCDGEEPVLIEKKTYKAGTPVYFIKRNDISYDTVKIFVWETFTNLKPLGKMDVIKLN